MICTSTKFLNDYLIFVLVVSFQSRSGNTTVDKVNTAAVANKLFRSRDARGQFSQYDLLNFQSYAVSIQVGLSETEYLNNSPRIGDTKKF